ncbi:hypothetical protein [Peribacillus simplex]|uniref:hypothetical protein n=1 Tax=Peribacillus simplex TaxID=1478 RepID=UPI0024C16E23|nr:hypothetical protein [Peribacillus simplex]WHY99506.1 hypothetical protein QNH37_10320 [Peribacillus simplex]
MKIIHIGVSGEVESLEIQEGEQVATGMALAYFRHPSRHNLQMKVIKKTSEHFVRVICSLWYI